MACKLHAAAMRFGDALHDRESEARTLVGHCHIVAALAECLENLQLILGSNADTGVAYAERDLSRSLDSGKDVNGAARRRKLHSIGKKIEQNLPDRALIVMKDREFGRDFGRQREVRQFRLRRHQLHRVANQTREIDIAFPKLELARFYLGKIQNVVDERQQVTARLMYELRIFLTPHRRGAGGD